MYLLINKCVSLSFKTIISYIDEQFERYLHDESGLNRRHIVDNRVHCCFYFISPFGHGCVASHSRLPHAGLPPRCMSQLKNWGHFEKRKVLGHLPILYLICDTSELFSLKPLDVAFMKAIHNKVNIVPVIAKADTLTLKERERLKRRVSPPGSWEGLGSLGRQKGSSPAPFVLSRLPAHAESYRRVPLMIQTSATVCRQPCLRKSLFTSLLLQNGAILFCCRTV